MQKLDRFLHGWLMSVVICAAALPVGAPAQRAATAAPESGRDPQAELAVKISVGVIRVGVAGGAGKAR
jgi:hypothetical protein